MSGEGKSDEEDDGEEGGLICFSYFLFLFRVLLSWGGVTGGFSVEWRGRDDGVVEESRMG